MKKKMILSLAASLTIFGAPLASNTEAAAPVKQENKTTCYVQYGEKKVVVPKEIFIKVNNGSMNKEQLKKYINKLQGLNNQASKPVQQPSETVKPAKPVETTKPTEEAAKPSPGTSQPSTETTKPETNTSTQANTSAMNEFEKQVVSLTNAERAKSGLKPFEIDAELSKVAREKSQDMLAKNYFSHTSPTYGSPFDMMKKFGISYTSAGENIAKGQRSPEEVVKGWMNSDGHRANILNAGYTHIGVGYVADGNIWTQMFIKK